MDDDTRLHNEDQYAGESTERSSEEPAVPIAGPLLLSDLTTSEMTAIAADIELILIPIGAHEQHGPALPVSTDTLTAQILCSLTGALLRPRVAVAPAIPWGVSWHHLGMAGTISLREETLIALVMDIVGSLSRHGFTRVVLINTHGGNNSALAIAAERCHRKLGVPLVAPIYGYSLLANAAAEILGPDALGHGGGDEASAVMAIRPELVRPELLADPEIDPEFRQTREILRAAGGSLPVMQHLASPSGATGDSRFASGEAGTAILGRAAGQLQAIIEHLLTAKLPTPPLRNDGR